MCCGNWRRKRVNPMPEVYAVVGESNTGKSSIIRALTGVGNIASVPNNSGPNQHWRLSWIIGGVVPTFVQGSGLQEVPSNEQDFVALVTQTGSRKIIVALRLRQTIVQGETYADADAYLTHFHSVGWAVSGVAKTGSGLVGAWPTISITPQGPTVGANTQAAALRAAWQIL
jgi:hypothetical protein